MLTINPKEIKTSQFHAYMLSAIAPRPIAFASTVDKDGNRNLAPFSFFNAFGSKPPIVVFSPARRVRDNTTKHTLDNIYETKEVVINVVNYAMVHQTSLASHEYPKGTDEFVKAHFTPLPSVLVKPFRVMESPVQMECKVLQVIETGHEGGAANLVVCEIVLMHIHDEILSPDGRIDPQKIDLVARMGGNYYCRASGDAIFEVEKPNIKLGIGIDGLPEDIRRSKILTGNNLGQLGNLDVLPSENEIKEFKALPEIANIFNDYRDNPVQLREKIHVLAKQLLDSGKVVEAWKVLLCK